MNGFSGQDLFSNLNDNLSLAEAAIRQMAQLGKDKAEAERAYRTALAEKMLKERAEHNTPVSMLSDVCRGDRTIALLKVKRDCADSLYEANLQAIYLYKKRADVVQQQINLEWGQAR